MTMGDSLCCYRCGACVAVDADEPFDALADRDQWPDLACPATPGCAGRLEAEALN